MHLSSAAISAILATSASALALPTSPSNPLLARGFNPLPNDPSMTPVDVQDLAHRATMTCGRDTFSYKDIYAAIQWGTILEKENLGRGKKSKDYPNGRFPHDYIDGDFKFNDNCPSDDYNRQEFPLIFDGSYNGGISNNVQYGLHRVVYYDKGEEAVDGNPIVYFCGGVTHEGAEKGKFLQCTVNN